MSAARIRIRIRIQACGVKTGEDSRRSSSSSTPTGGGGGWRGGSCLCTHRRRRRRRLGWLCACVRTRLCAVCAGSPPSCVLLRGDAPLIRGDAGVGEWAGGWVGLCPRCFKGAETDTVTVTASPLNPPGEGDDSFPGSSQ